MKYVSIPEFVTAEVYRPGLEDGWVLYWSDFWDNYREYFVTKEEAEWYGKRISPEEFEDLIVETPVPYIGNKRSNQMVHPGDFILTHKDGSRTVISPEEFHRKYEEVR